MYQRLITFINKHKLLYDYQFGFRKNSSTAMALITIIDKITESLERGDNALGMFLDFSKTFDTVDHSILLNKLHNYRIRGIALDWFDNYLKKTENSLLHITQLHQINCELPVEFHKGQLWVLYSSYYILMIYQLCRMPHFLSCSLMIHPFYIRVIIWTLWLIM